MLRPITVYNVYASGGQLFDWHVLWSVWLFDHRQVNKVSNLKRAPPSVCQTSRCENIAATLLRGSIIYSFD